MVIHGSHVDNGDGYVSQDISCLYTLKHSGRKHFIPVYVSILFMLVSLKLKQNCFLGWARIISVKMDFFSTKALQRGQKNPSEQMLQCSI